MDKLTAARVFIDVTSTLNFTTTAKRLNMSRPMVTRNIEAMEDWLNVRLLHRTTRKISLTSAGESSLKDIEKWIAQAESLSASISPSEQELSANIRITTTVSLSYSLLVPTIHDFMKIHPKVNIDIFMSSGMTDLVEKQIDLAIRIASDPDPSLIGKPISINDFVLVASPSYISENSNIIKPSDLIEHDYLGYDNFMTNTLLLSKNGKDESVNVKSRLTANEITTLLHAAIQGAGISLQPRYLANSYIKDGQLSVVLPKWDIEPLKIYVLYSSRKNLSPAVRALIDHLTIYFQNPKW